MPAPFMTAAQERQHATFTALMWALSYPGRPKPLPVGGRAAFDVVGDTLLDLETGFYTPDPELAAELARTGARSLPPAEAPYQFYSRLDKAALAILAQAPVGTHVAPELGATLVIGCVLEPAQTLELRGPGIDGAIRVGVGGIPAELWELRSTACRFPLGWDMFLVAGDQIIGLPRTTLLEVL